MPKQPTLSDLLELIATHRREFGGFTMMADGGDAGAAVIDGNDDGNDDVDCCC